MRFHGKIKWVPAVVASVLVVCAVLLATAFTTSEAPAAAENSRLYSYSASATPPPPEVDLQPGVLELIANTYLAHAAEFPDPNETVEALRLYLEGNKLLWENRVEEARDIFTRAVELQPDSRHAHAGLGGALWQRYQSTKKADDLRFAVEEFIHAAQIGIIYGKVRYTYSIAVGLAELRDVAHMEEFFRQALQLGDESYLTHLDYAQGLAMLGDLRAEEWYKKAIALQPKGNVDALAYYAEWLLDQGELNRVLELIPPTVPSPYLHLLRGVALERMGRIGEARQAYARYAPVSAIFPVPARYRIEGSVAQEGLYFEGEAEEPSPLQSCLTNISQSIYCEARGENGGGMRNVGWTMRNRVFAHTPSNPCLNFGISGATLCAKYVSAINAGFCACADNCRTTSSTDWAAADIYYGRTPEGYTGWCPNGTYPECMYPCDPNRCRCSSDQTQGGRRYGMLYMYGTSGTCPSQHPCCGACTVNRGKLCGNGGSDNCFYTVP